MFKKYQLVLIILVVLIILGSGFLVWRNFRATAVVGKEYKPFSFNQETSYPKVEKFEIPILMYHYIRVAPANDQLGANLSVSPENFAAQVKWLYDDNYRSIKLADLADSERKEISRIYHEEKKPIVFTFDDGYLDAYTQAFPVLKKYGFIGTFFIIKDYVDRENYLTGEKIREMEEAKMEFGSHTLTHPDLTKISINEARRQIFDSKGEWQVFCYPAGRFDETVVGLVKEAGYLAAVTTKIGVARQDDDLLELRRVRVEDVSAQELMDKISYAYEYGSQ
mgnify:CR=1 FL=1